MLTALVGGMEASIRIALPALNKFHLRGFHTTSMAVPFGAALIAAKLEKTGLQQTIDALGISGSFTSGLLECVPAGAGSKRLHAGWGGMCGIIAAQFAQENYSGPHSVFEGKLGVYNSFLRGETLDPEMIFNRLGGKWEILDVRPKLYPCCHYLQAFLDCAAALRGERNFQIGEFAAIACRVAPGAVNIVCEPWQNKLAPETGYDARFSLPFAIALMLVRGRAGIAEFSADNAKDAQIRQLMAKISYVTDPGYQVKDMPGWVEVTLKDGAKHVHEVPEVRGDAKHPFTLAELRDKFNANTAFLGAAESRRIADDILALEKLADVRGLMARLGEPHNEGGCA